MTRATVYTPEAHEKIVQALLAGSSFRDACEATGVAWRTWRDWRKAVEDEGGHNDERINDLVREARRAHSRSTTSLVAAVALAAKKDWRAALGLLEFRANASRRRADQVRAWAEARAARKSTDGHGKSSLEVPTILAAPRMDPDAPAGDP